MIKTVLYYEPPIKGAPENGAPLFGPFDPYLNLAREEVLLRSLHEGEILLYLWQNQNTVVIGKNQNCFKECHVSLLQEEGGFLTRRLSGGGAVFHDLGNLNYTFLAQREDFDVARQTNVILKAVESFGIQAEASGRNDITVGGRKFSGNAYYLSKGPCYQHGTILMEVNPEKIGRYLQVSREKLQSKGVSSVRSRVMGLKEFAPSMTVDQMKKAIREAFQKEYGENYAKLDPKIIEEKALELRKTYVSSEWLYGKRLSFTYSFEKRFAWGGCEVQLEVKDGLIRNCAIFTDALDTQWPNPLEKKLTGLPCRPEAIRSLLNLENTEFEQDVLTLVIESL